MRKIKIAIGLVFCAMMMLTLVGCGSASETGKYAFYSMTFDGVTESAEEMEALGAEPDRMYLILDEDGTGMMSMMGAIDEFTWHDRTLVEEDGTEVPFTLEDGILTISSGNGDNIQFKHE